QVMFREVLWRTGGSLEAVRAQCDALTLELVSQVEKGSTLERMSLASLESMLLEGVARARNTAELELAFTTAAQSLASAVQGPFRVSLSARLEAARRYIDNNLERTLRVADVAARAGLSKNYFSTQFHRHAGQRFDRYVLEQRLERARLLLLSSNLVVSRVGEQVGFRSAIHFSLAFKRQYALPPAAFRRREQRRNGSAQAKGARPRALAR
ncbi:MAG TPA: AraC family transcriptional regulator, partial [Polyangiaceae bacterium]|nr:AraC family transcriptional regulator [Polyangiaceae bacterium]